VLSSGALEDHLRPEIASCFVAIINATMSPTAAIKKSYSIRNTLPRLLCLGLTECEFSLNKVKNYLITVQNICFLT